MMQICEICENLAVTVRERDQKFVYGSGDEEVILSALVPVFECEACGESYTGEVGERRRHEAVCNYLERLTPAEIKMLREGYGMSQEQFAEVSKFGIASIKRWERGNQIQSASADNMLRLLRLPQNFRLVQRKNSAKSWQPQFKTKLSERTKQHAREFQLRRPVELEKVAA